MSISGKFINYQGVAVTIGGIDSAHFAETAVELPKDSGASAGYGNRDSGLLDVTVSIKGWIDVGAGTFPGGVTSGTQIVNGNIPVNANGSLKLITMPLGLVLSFNAGAETRGRLDFDATIRNQGCYTIGTL